jgi:hypothetical protein
VTDGNLVSLFLTIPSEEKGSRHITNNNLIVIYKEFTCLATQSSIIKDVRMRENSLTVSKSSEYKSFKVLDFDVPPNIKRVLSS